MSACFKKKNILQGNLHFTALGQKGIGFGSILQNTVSESPGAPGLTWRLLIFFQKKREPPHGQFSPFLIWITLFSPKADSFLNFYIASTTASSTSSNVSMVSFNVSASSSVIVSWEISPISLITSAAWFIRSSISASPAISSLSYRSFT